MESPNIITCKNCQTEFSGKYCNNCGQESNTPRIGLKFILGEFQKLFIKFDHGFFYTLKTLTLDPGHTLKSYIEGKRVKHIKPLTFVLLTAGTYSLLYLYFNLDLIPVDPNDSSSSDLNHQMRENYSYIQLLIIPLFALASVLAFPGRKYNLYEYFIINAFLCGHRICINLFLFPFAYLANNSDHIQLFTNVTFVIGALYLFWAYSTLFETISKTKIIAFTILAYIYLFIMLGGLILLYKAIR